MTRLSGYATSIALIAIGGVHIAWGLGSSFPYTNRAELADAVVGTREVPPATACGAVATALFVAGGLAADVPIGSARLRQFGRRAVAAVLLTRGILGLIGRTDLVSPGSSSERFRSLDRRLFGPLCLALAIGCTTATKRR